jgi:O-antigen/teichoic acid export membrane protein
MPLLRDVRDMGLSTGIGVVLTTLRAILALRLAGPDASGVWKSVMVLYVAAEFLKLGVVRGMTLRLPVLLGQGRKEEADRLVQTAASWALLVGLVLSAGCLAASCFAATTEYQLAFRIMALVIFCAQPHLFLRELASATRQFPLRAKEVLLASTVDFVLTLLLTWQFGLAGLGLGTFFCVFLPACYLWRAQGFRFQLRWRAEECRTLVGEGARFAMADGAFGLMRLVDTLVLSLLIGPHAMGEYSLAALMGDFALFFSTMAVGQVITPHVLHHFGSNGCLAGASRVYETPLRLLTLAMPPCLGMGVLVLPLLIERLLPQYMEGVAAAQVTIWGAFFIIVYASLTALLQGAQRFGSVLRLYAIIIPILAATQIWQLQGGTNLQGLAISSLVALVLLTTGALWIARREGGQSPAAAVLWILGLYAPLGLAMLLTQWLDSTALSLPWKLALVAVGYLPLLMLAESRLSLLRSIREGTS